MKETFVTQLKDCKDAARAIQALLETGFAAADLKIAAMSAALSPHLLQDQCRQVEINLDKARIFLRERAEAGALLRMESGRSLDHAGLNRLLDAIGQGACLLALDAEMHQLGFVQQLLREILEERLNPAGPRAEVHYLVGRRSQERGGNYVITPEERRRMIAEAAYFRAQERGFGADGQLEDWLVAEREILQRLEPSKVGADRSSEPLLLPTRREVATNNPSWSGMVERRILPEQPRNPERRRACALPLPANSA